MESDKVDMAHVDKTRLTTNLAPNGEHESGIPSNLGLTISVPKTPKSEPEFKVQSPKSLRLNIHQENADIRADCPAESRIPLHEEPGDCSVMQVAFNIVNTTVGAGVIGLPFALKEAGFGLGIILAVLVAYLTNISLILMVLAGNHIRVFSFPGLAQSAFGISGFWAVNWIVVINGLGTMVSYLIIIGDVLPALAHSYIRVSLFENRFFIISMCSLCFILPLLWWRSVGKLAQVSLIGVTCVPIIIVTVSYRAFYYPGYAHDNQPITLTLIGNRVFPAIGVMAFSFVSNQTAFLNFLSLRQQNIIQWSKSTTIAVTISLCISLSLAIIGFITFGENVEANLLTNFPNTDNWINFCRFILAISMILTYPMQFYPTRSCVYRMLGLESETRRPSNREHILITLLLFACILSIGMAVHNLGKVYELVGAFCSTMIAYVFPAGATLILFWPQKGSNLENDVHPETNDAKHEVDTGDDSASSTGEFIDGSDQIEDDTPLLGGHAIETRLLQNSRILLMVAGWLILVFGFLSMIAGTGLSLWNMIEQ